VRTTRDRRAVCGRTARTVRREGRRKPSLPLSEPSLRTNAFSYPPSALRPLDARVRGHDNLGGYEGRDSQAGAPPPKGRGWGDGDFRDRAATGSDAVLSVENREKTFAFPCISFSESRNIKGLRPRLRTPFPRARDPRRPAEPSDPQMGMDGASRPSRASATIWPTRRSVRFSSRAICRSIMRFVLADRMNVDVRRLRALPSSMPSLVRHSHA